jgi:hypothetical protein
MPRERRGNKIRLGTGIHLYQMFEIHVKILILAKLKRQLNNTFYNEITLTIKITVNAIQFAKQIIKRRRF